MKTPQEEAEEMVGKLTSAMIPIHKNEDPYPVLREREYLTAAIKTFAPIAELIAVARAAKAHAGSVSGCCMTGERTGEVCELHRALQSLRATGKITL